MAGRNNLLDRGFGPSKHCFDGSVTTIADPAIDAETLCSFGRPRAKPNSLNAAGYPHPD